jgi:hypothetical protein
MMDHQQQAARGRDAEVEPSCSCHPTHLRIKARLYPGSGDLQLLDPRLGQNVCQMELGEINVYAIVRQIVLSPAGAVANEAAAQRVVVIHQGCECALDQRRLDVASSSTAWLKWLIGPGCVRNHCWIGVSRPAAAVSPGEGAACERPVTSASAATV